MRYSAHKGASRSNFILLLQQLNSSIIVISRHSQRLADCPFSINSMIISENTTGLSATSTYSFAAAKLTTSSIRHSRRVVLPSCLALFIESKANPAIRLPYSPPILIIRKDCVTPLRQTSYLSQRRISEPTHRTHMSMPRLDLCLAAAFDSSTVKWSLGGNRVSELNPKHSLVYQSLAGIVVRSY